ncbi:carbohydrate ABC transporter permease [Candidatus Caldatribacterium sp.]|uniref:carbohydrate ABC transporter permease n=1 Tax=Candidatus Caldatribacterium sp. TaxID=2282143 RepID=UPI003843216C|nr:carbohydrate ABC transporter permease [Candidatus Caldatribacterium sp.]
MFMGTLGKVFFWLITALVLFVIVAPLAWIYLTAFKSPNDIFTTEARKLIFFKPTMENFHRLFQEFPFWDNFLNTLVISVSSTAVVMVISSLAAYSFARWNTGKGHLLFTTISTRMFPGVVAAIPFFVMYRDLGLLDTRFGLALLHIYFNTSFATFLLYGFFKEIPEELEQAAMVDGYSRVDVFRKIVLPLVRPGLAVTAVFCLVWSWNEFLFSFLFTRVAARPVTVLISSFWGSIEVQYGPMAAGAAIVILPTLIAAWFMQRYIIRGLTFGAVKG